MWNFLGIRNQALLVSYTSYESKNFLILEQIFPVTSIVFINLPGTHILHNPGVNYIIVGFTRTIPVKWSNEVKNLKILQNFHLKYNFIPIGSPKNAKMWFYAIQCRSSQRQYPMTPKPWPIHNISRNIYSKQCHEILAETSTNFEFLYIITL